jgi:hypothetical protein
MFMTSRDCGSVFLLVMITCICLGHIICTFEDSTKNKISIFQVPPIVEKIVLIKIKQLSVYLLTQFNNSQIPN